MSRKKAQDWVEAKSRCRLNAEDIRMAKELGMTPRALLKNIPSPQQLWKQPVKEWVRDLHVQKFGRPERPQQPLPMLSIPQAEQALVAANRELISRFEQKIQVTLDRIWGEEKV